MKMWIKKDQTEIITAFKTQTFVYFTRKKNSAFHPKWKQVKKCFECLPSNATLRLKKLLEEIRRYQKKKTHEKFSCLLVLLWTSFSSFLRVFSLHINCGGREKKKHVLKFLCWKLNLNIFASILPNGRSSEIVKQQLTEKKTVFTKPKKKEFKTKKKLILIMGFKFFFFRPGSFFSVV